MSSIGQIRPIRVDASQDRLLDFNYLPNRASDATRVTRY